MTIDELEQISIDIRKTVMLTDRYETLLNKSQAKGQIISDMPTAHNASDTIGNYISDLDELREELLEKELHNILLIKKARRFIESIPDSTIRMILELKYINNLYYEDIVGCIGVDGISKEEDIIITINTFFLDSVLYL